MAIQHHEDITVYRTGIVHHPLSGRPEFKGLIPHADGPMARIQDGDLVFTIDDIDLLIRWRDAFSLAAVQLGMARERMARHAANGTEEGRTP
jgi:hypothetical protein